MSAGGIGRPSSNDTSLEWKGTMVTLEKDALNQLRVLSSGIPGSNTVHRAAPVRVKPTRTPDGSHPGRVSSNKGTRPPLGQVRYTMYLVAMTAFSAKTYSLPEHLGGIWFYKQSPEQPQTNGMSGMRRTPPPNPLPILYAKEKRKKKKTLRGSPRKEKGLHLQ